MRCPFCDEEIKDTALVCKHCGRDLNLLRPLLGRFRELEERLDAVETALHAIGVHVDALDKGEHSAAPGQPAGGRYVPRAMSLLPALAAILLLIGAHGLIVGVLDLNTWVLRLVSIVIPLPFGWLRPRSTATAAVTAFAIATISILGMLFVTSRIDHVPLLPQTGRDWLEIAEYAASIGLSYMTGCLLGWGMAARRALSEGTEGSLIYEIASLVASHSAPRGETRAKAKMRIEAIANYLNILALLMTATCSIATGIGHFLP